MTKTLIVGGNGFIGSHLADRLTSIGREVTVFDRFSRGVQNYESESVRRCQGDFLSVDDLQRAVVDQDDVFHFLSVTTPASAQKDPLIDVRVNIAQSVELFDACSKAGVKRLYFASSGGAVYGESSNSRARESDPTSPKSPYAIAKLTLEHYLEYYHVVHGLDYTVLRISNPYGPRQNPIRPQGLIPIVLRRIAQDLPVIQYGDGTMVRDYIYVSDVIDMIAAMLDNSGSERCYNIGSGIGYSVTEIFEVIRDVTGKNFEVEQRPRPTTYVSSVVLDTYRFQREFGIPAATNLPQGIQKTWESLT
ncbi:NAD-dependent epimerase/dehydratase family protein [Sinomonas albida]|uniref:NAD-dependent epimerase/dehydratase family protein n=1 Tax=Sinomonas albida TaxID=369942 RepID=UPI00301A70B8